LDEKPCSLSNETYFIITRFERSKTDVLKANKNNKNKRGGRCFFKIFDTFEIFSKRWTGKVKNSNFWRRKK